jgi:hypothetical protein
MPDILFDLLKEHGIELAKNGKIRNPVDVLEDFYLKISTDEYTSIIKKISETESIEGHIFDQARNKPYE